ncbi:MAG: hypothetical protein ACR2N3_12390 [Pyrinomonadaceae bacterium]
MIKYKIYHAICYLFLLSCMVAAQEARKAPEPEYLGQPYYLDSASEALVALDRQMAVTKTSLKALGYGGATVAYEIKGRKSPIRLKSDQKIEFIVRVASLQADPSSVIQLVSLKAEKDKRKLVTGKVTPLGLGGSTTDPNAGAMQFNASKYGESSLKIVPAQALVPGEYALKAPGASDVFYCFGVDAGDGSSIKQK